MSTDPQLDIETRLRETSEHCFNCYQSWQGAKKDSAKREELESAIHELRKVASRLEIELAASEGGEGAAKMKAPNHRAAKRRQSSEGKKHEPKKNDAPKAEEE